MKNSVIKMLLFLTSVLVMILISCNNNLLSRKVQNQIDSISAVFAPDKRESICNITAQTGKGETLILLGETSIPKAKNEIIKTLSKEGNILIDSIIILPDTTVNTKYMGLVTLSVINLRKEPDHRAELVSQAILGTPVLILKSAGSWIQVQTPDRYISWTEKSSVRLLGNQEMNEWKNADRVIFKSNFGWIYAGPDEKEVVGDIVAGSIVERIGNLNGYTSIVLPDGRKGFVEDTRLADFDIWKTGVSATGESVTETALSFLGVPYLWGGSSVKAVDCSGFVQSVFFINGIILSRDASLQAEHGIQVDISRGFGQLKRGDLLFFGSGANSGARVTHVAVYIGDSCYINSSGRVMINSLDSAGINYSSYRRNSLLLARRVIGVENDMGIVPVSEHKWY